MRVQYTFIYSGWFSLFFCRKVINALKHLKFKGIKIRFFANYKKKNKTLKHLYVGNNNFQSIKPTFSNL